MLPERVFALGGWLCVLAAALLVVAALLNPNPFFWAMIETAGLFAGMGGFFVYVGRGARRDRRRLLDSPQPPA